MKHQIRRARYDVRTYLGRYPIFFLPLLRTMRGKRDSVIRHWLQPRIFNETTELVVEGYPRSGNTFAVAALHVATSGDLPSLAHHIHLPAQILGAVHTKTPALSLIRQPLDAMASTLIYDPRLGPWQVLRAYVHFYEPLMKHRDQFVTAKFETVISDYGVVIDALNDHYGLSIPAFEHTDDDVKRCFELIDEKTSFYTGKVAQNQVARPSTDRKQKNEDAKELLQQPQYAHMMRRANVAYEAFLETAVATPTTCNATA